MCVCVRVTKANKFTRKLNDYGRVMENYVKLPSRYFFSSSIVQACSRNGILKYKFKEPQWFAPRFGRIKSWKVSIDFSS